MVIHPQAIPILPNLAVGVKIADRRRVGMKVVKGLNFCIRLVPWCFCLELTLDWISSLFIGRGLMMLRFLLDGEQEQPYHHDAQHGSDQDHPNLGGQHIQMFPQSFGNGYSRNREQPKY